MKAFVLIWSVGLIVYGAVLPANAAQKIKAPQALPLPKGVSEYSKKESGCFLKGEAEAYDAYIKSTAVAVSSCSEKFIPPTKKIIANRYYKAGSGGSIYDCAKLRTNRFAPGGISLAREHIVAFADKKLAAPKNSKEEHNDATCLANVLYAWAEAQALTVIGTTGGQGELVQVWNSGTLASIYAKYPIIKKRAQAMTAKGGKSTKDAVIKSWLSKIGKNIADYAKAAKRKGQTNKKDHRYQVNTMFWRGYALTAIGLHTEEVELIERARDIFDTALRQITKDGLPREKGYLPHELLRRGKAGTYHAFALKPILGMVTLSRTMNCNFLRSGGQEQRLGFLVRKIAQGGKIPKVFQEAAYCHINGACTDGIVTMEQTKQVGKAQVEPSLPLLGKPSEAQYKRVMAHVKPYLDQRKIAFAPAKAKPLVQDYLGGDVSKYSHKKEHVPKDKKLRKFCGI